MSVCSGSLQYIRVLYLSNSRMFCTFYITIQRKHIAKFNKHTLLGHTRYTDNWQTSRPTHIMLNITQAQNLPFLKTGLYVLARETQAFRPTSGKISKKEKKILS